MHLFSIFLTPLLIVSSFAKPSQPQLKESRKGLRGSLENQRAAPRQRSPVSEGEEWLSTVEKDLRSSLSPVIGKIVDDVNQPTAISGSWPAMQLAEARRRGGFAAPKLLANDIDAYYEHGTSTEESQDLEVVYSSISYHNIILPNGEEAKISTVGAKGLTWRRLLDNNDLDVTGVVFWAFRNDSGELEIEFHVSEAFWKFLLSGAETGKFVIRPVDGNRGIKTLVRIAYKAYQQGLDYDISMIVERSGTIARSHSKKMEEMKDWPNTPFHEISITTIVADDGRKQLVVQDSR